MPTERSLVGTFPLCYGKSVQSLITKPKFHDSSFLADRPDLLQTSLQGCHNDATRKTDPMEFQLYQVAGTCLGSCPAPSTDLLSHVEGKWVEVGFSGCYFDYLSQTDH